MDVWMFVCTYVFMEANMYVCILQYMSFHRYRENIVVPYVNILCRFTKLSTAPPT